MKIISGGQTGIDKMGLEIARELGVQTGGTAAKGFRTELGPDLSLIEFGLVEHSDHNYPARTRQNVADSDGTVLFGDMTSHGSFTTIRACTDLGKPYIPNPSIEKLVAWLRLRQIDILNVAGNRGSKLNFLQLRMFGDILRSSVQIYLELPAKV